MKNVTNVIPSTKPSIKAAGILKGDGQGGVSAAVPGVDYLDQSAAPNIGTNGNWFLGTEDTGVRANGQTNTELISLTILASDWNTETGEVVVNCAGISANEADQIVTLIPSVESKAACNEAAIECIAIDTNSFTLKADTIPTEDIHIYVAMEVVGSVQAKETYSLEEQVIGTWIDGKPLYRQVIVFTITTAGKNAVIRTNHTLMESCCRMNAVVQSNRTGNIKTTDSNNEAMRMYESSDGWIYVETKGDTWNGCSCIVVLEYTKPTDAATINLPDAAAMAASYEQGVNET